MGNIVEYGFCVDLDNGRMFLTDILEKTGTKEIAVLFACALATVADSRQELDAHHVEQFIDEFKGELFDLLNEKEGLI